MLPRAGAALMEDCLAEALQQRHDGLNGVGRPSDHDGAVSYTHLSLYAKDNVNYTRSWIADNTPYMMFGVNAKYPVTDKLTVAGFIVNGYYHLSHPNDQPSYGGQWAYKATPQLTLTQTVYGGPDQTNTAVSYTHLDVYKRQICHC